MARRSACTGLAMLLLGAAAARAEGVQQGCLSDGSFSTRLCVRIYYDDLAVKDAHYVRLTRVQATAVRTSAQVVLTDLRVGAVVLGRCLVGCQALDSGKLLVNLPFPTSRTWYAGVPPWSQRWILVGGASHQCGTAAVFWRRGGRNFRYTMDVCFGMPPDALSLSGRARGLR